jgi:hypothetical protein
MIKLVGDVAAPGTVIAADIATMEMAPQANEWTSYGLSILGYVSALFGIGRGNLGDYLKNLGVASLPLTARHIYERVKAPVSRRAASTSKRIVLQNIANPSGASINRSYQPEFEYVTPHAF